MNKLPIRLILSDIRSALNVGAILRTADAAGIEMVYACGYTPYPKQLNDTRAAHIASSNTLAIAKTALGAEIDVPVKHFSDTASAINEARSIGFKIIVLEQAERSLNLYHYHPEESIALVVGNEVTGVLPEDAQLADHVLEIPMIGSKESLNVSAATAVAVYQLRFGSTAN
jgi:23S rRNA (guanosine2251-2'-O)-methyltransferase